jgi:ribosomal protein S21|tara:strand:- start:260 stop:508 length:249 start_codon:yes stop_codon:yes gene_type:complete
MAVKKGNNVSVTAQECRGNHERMIRKFIKKCKKERIVEECREKSRYKKPSVAKKEKHIRAMRERARRELKIKRAQEKRQRKK